MRHEISQNCSIFFTKIQNTIVVTWEGKVCSIKCSKMFTIKQKLSSTVDQIVKMFYVELNYSSQRTKKVENEAEFVILERVKLSLKPHSFFPFWSNLYPFLVP